MRPGPGETQPERTALSWQRTALGVLAVSGIIAHRALVTSHPELLVVAGSCGLLGVALISMVGTSRDAQVRRAAERDAPVDSPALALAGTAVVVLVALAAVVAILAVRLT